MLLEWGKEVRRERFVASAGDVGSAKEGYSCCSVAVLGIKLWYWVWREQRVYISLLSQHGLAVLKPLYKILGWSKWVNEWWMMAKLSESHQKGKSQIIKKSGCKCALELEFGNCDRKSCLAYFTQRWTNKNNDMCVHTSVHKIHFLDLFLKVTP